MHRFGLELCNTQATATITFCDALVSCLLVLRSSREPEAPLVALHLLLGFCFRPTVHMSALMADGIRPGLAGREGKNEQRQQDTIRIPKPQTRNPTTRHPKPKSPRHKAQSKRHKPQDGRQKPDARSQTTCAQSQKPTAKTHTYKPQTPYTPQNTKPKAQTYKPQAASLTHTTQTTHH